MNKFQHATQSEVLDDFALKDIALKSSIKTSPQVIGGGAVGVAEPEVEAAAADGPELEGVGSEHFGAIAFGAAALANPPGSDAPKMVELHGIDLDKINLDTANLDSFESDESSADEFDVVDELDAGEFDSDEFAIDEFAVDEFAIDDFDAADFDADEFAAEELNADDFGAALHHDEDEFDSAEFDAAEFDAAHSPAQNRGMNLDDALDLDDAVDLDAVDLDAVDLDDVADLEDGVALDDAVDTVGEVMEVEVIDSQERDRSYEVYQEGSLTYFRYYLDDEEDGGFYDHEAIASPRPFLSAGAMGVGVLAVTFGVGLLVAEATNRRAQNRIEADVAEASQQPIGSKRVATKAKGDPTFPESLKPDWSSADKAFGKSVTAKSGKSSLLAKSTSAEDKVSLAAAKIKGDSTQIAAASAAKPGAYASTWNSSAAATPYIPPAMAVTPIVTPNYQVVASSKLSPAPIPKLTAVPVQPTGLVSAEQRQLAMRIEAMRKASKASNGRAAQSAQTLQTSSSLAQAATESVWLPNPDRRTYVTDPVRPASGPLVTPVEGAYEASTEVRKGGIEGSGVGNSVAAAPTQPSLLDAPSGAVSDDALQRAEIQKQLMNQAIAKPVSGLLVVPVAAPNSGAETIPLDAVPSTSSFRQPEAPSNEAQDESLLEAEVPSDALTVEVVPAGADDRAAVQSLQELMTLPGSSAQLRSASQQPLARGVAEEVLSASNQLDRFRVLSLNPADYSQLWRMSTNSSDRLMAPAYGFVDYQRSVIAVVQSNGIARGMTRGTAPVLERSQVQQLAQALTPAAGELSRP